MTQFKMPSPRWVLVALLLLPVAWLLIWLIVGKLTNTTTGTASDLSGLLASLGGIMGAIFTVGGLLIALVSVLSQLTLEDRAKRVMEEKFNELAPALEQRADAHSEGRIAYNSIPQYIGLEYWSVVEGLAQVVLEKYPELPRFRSMVALGMAKAVVKVFAKQVGGQSTLMPDDLQRMQHGYTLPEAEPPTAQALIWLDKAQSAGDDPQGQVSAYQALLYGFTEAYQKMIESIGRAVKSDSETKDTANEHTSNKGFLTAPECLSMLVYACNNDRGRLEQLGAALGITLPVPIDAVRKSLDQIGTKRFIDYVKWYAAQAPLGTKPPRLVAMVLLYKRDDKEHGRLAQARVFARGQRYAIPAVHDDYLPEAELMSKLEGQLLFICQTEAGA